MLSIIFKTGSHVGFEFEIRIPIICIFSFSRLRNCFKFAFVAMYGGKCLGMHMYIPLSLECLLSNSDNINR